RCAQVFGWRRLMLLPRTAREDLPATRRSEGMLPLTSTFTPVLLAGSSPSSLVLLLARSVVTWLASATDSSEPGRKTQAAMVNGLATSKCAGGGKLSVDLPENCSAGVFGSGPAAAVTPAGRSAGGNVTANVSAAESIGVASIFLFRSQASNCSRGPSSRRR